MMTKYAVGIMRSEGGLAGLYGPTPNLEDCLQYNPSYDPNAEDINRSSLGIYEFIDQVGIMRSCGSRKLCSWNTQLNKWVDVREEPTIRAFLAEKTGATTVESKTEGSKIS